MKNILFGAGRDGKRALWMLKSKGVHVDYFVDNDMNKQGKVIHGIPVIGMNELINMKEEYTLSLSVNKKHKQDIERQLQKEGIANYTTIKHIDLDAFKNSRENITSYSYAYDMEDVILYHIFHEMDEIFYLDVGCNEPCAGSVTKLLYDLNKAHGINIDPQPYVIEMMKRERQRDINLCCGVGNKEGIMNLYCQGGLSTMVKDNVRENEPQILQITMHTLRMICDTYVKNKAITFLKVDVEGFEKEVLQGADFTNYRPYLIVVESTLPSTDIPSYEEWEAILLSQQYHFAYTHGVNRYYVADECRDLDQRFSQIQNFDDIRLLYNIRSARFEYFDEV